MFERRPAEQAIERLRGAKERVLALRNQLDADLRAAQAYTNPDLSYEGLTRRRQELAQAARSKAAPLIERERSILDADLATVARWAGQHRPRLGEDAAAVQRAGIRWEGIKAKLGAGIPLAQVLASADLEALVALEAWGPDWLEAAHRQAEDPSKAEALREPADVAGFRRAVAVESAVERSARTTTHYSRGSPWTSSSTPTTRRTARNLRNTVHSVNIVPAGQLCPDPSPTPGVSPGIASQTHGRQQGRAGALIGSGPLGVPGQAYCAAACMAALTAF